MSARTRPTALRRAAAFPALGVAFAATAAPAWGAPNRVPLNVGQETTGSDTGASGSFTYTVSGDELCYTLTARHLSVPAAAAHIHVAPPARRPGRSSSRSAWATGPRSASPSA